MLTGMFFWWYGRGWALLVQRMGANINGVLRFFSVGQLAGSLFAPFRQISAGRVRGSLNTQFRALVDRLFSRLVGAAVRLILIFAGLTFALGVSVVAVVAIVAWPIVPLLPIIGLVFGLGVR